MLFALRQTFRSLVVAPLIVLWGAVTIGTSLALGLWLIWLGLLGGSLTGIVGVDTAVTVFLLPDISEEQAAEVRRGLQSLPEVMELRWVSADQARERLRTRLGDAAAVLDDLEFNPLPHSFELILHREALEAEALEALVLKVKALRGVQEVEADQGVRRTLVRLSLLGRQLAGWLLFLLALAAGFAVAGVVRLTLERRGRELQILGLLGATPWQLRWPVVLEGVVLALLGFVLALLIFLPARLRLAQTLAGELGEYLPQAQLPDLSLFHLAALGLGVALTGVLAALIAVWNWEP